MRRLALFFLAIGSLSAASLPDQPLPQTKEYGLAGTWTLMHTEWLGNQIDDQAVRYYDRELEKQFGTEVDVEVRYRITFEKDRFIGRGDFLPHRGFDPGEVTKNTTYRLERHGQHQVLYTKDGRALIDVREDTLLLCVDMKNPQRLPRAVASDPQDDGIVLLVYRRGDFGRRIIKVHDVVGT